MIKALLVTALLLPALCFHLQEADVIGRVDNFLRKRTKFGDVYLHREHS